MEQLEATILGTVFRNQENGWSVVTVRSGRTELTVVGSLPELSAGEQAVFSGEWIEHRTYGRQFSCRACELKAPTTLLGIERYLGSGLIHGVGPSTATLIVEAFGEDTLTVLSEYPERLTEVKGIGEKRAAQIAESFREQQSTRRAIVFLQSYGISPALAVKISKFYGDRTPEVVREDPYRLCDDLEGIGFKTADRIGLSLGIPPESDSRIRCAMKYILRDAAASSGHVYLPEKELCASTASLLQVSPDLCSQALRELLVSGALKGETDDSTGNRRIYLPFYWRAEQEVALRLRELMTAIRPDKYAGALRAISAFEKRRSISFSPTQRQAIRSALENGVFVITGGPGTGKTTIINCILELLSPDNQTVLCAPTGRAAKRMTEATGTEACTIHRLLEYGGDEGVFSNEDNPIEADCVIADETSMIDLPLMRALLRAIEPGTRLILVGDADQLPSVGAGNVLGDILESGEVPSIRLTEIYRQSGKSRIVLNAHLINSGQMPVLNEKGTDFFFERKPSAVDAASSIAALATRRLPAYLGCPEDQFAAFSVRNIQVLAPARKGECGVNSLNLLLQEALNPPAPDKPQLTWGESIFRLGDKVIQTRNDYKISWRRLGFSGEEGAGIFNGDVGFVTAVDPESHSLTVLYDEEKEVVYESGDLEYLEQAYCLSVHKAQGSEFPVIVMPVTGGSPMLLTRNLLYTALTRAKNLVVLVGTEEVIRRMVANNHVVRRYTSLSQRLIETRELVR